MTKICDALGLRERKFKRDGSRWQELIGVELELENVPNQQQLPYWEVKADNSLRNGVEYILDQPYAGPTLESALDEFFDAELKWNNSARTSTHIHINMTDTTVATVQSMVMLMYTLDDAIYNIVGEGRKWGGYSMALSEMDPARLRLAMSSSDPMVVLHQLAPGKNQERYYGFNTASLRKHGTVEFRYFPGGPSREELENWIDLAVQIKRAAVENSPQQLIDRIHNPDSLVVFLSTYLSKYWLNAILNNIERQMLFTKFNQIAAMAIDPEVVEVRENLVFLTKPFLKFIKKKLLSVEGIKYIDEVTRVTNVVASPDWHHYLAIARERDNLPSVAPSLTSKKVGMKYVNFAEDAPVRAYAPLDVNPFNDVPPTAPMRAR